MLSTKQLDDFLSSYPRAVMEDALKIRKQVMAALPNVTEQLDLPAKMIAYGYGQKYSELICVLIPSKNGLKLGFNQGASFTDRNGLLQGKGKVSRYVVIETHQNMMPGIRELLKEAMELYKKRMSL